MIPQTEDDLQTDFEVEEEPSRTYNLNVKNKRLVGFTDELEAVKQAAFLILNIERYEHLIYSWDYGIELSDLFGQPISFVLPELKRRITEALTQDDRIQSVDAFSFDVNGKIVHVSFTVSSVFGDFDIERQVNI
ncbi:DUF2634 domain-containing protein [Robertmurraya massiliosenegalensis]|uniref:DUF2634 domain-containing protein n=1 Tax=Robertmurraya TaxID=2837507 RepID=UPI0039A49973